MKFKKSEVSAWGNYPLVECNVYRPESLESLKQVVSNSNKIIPMGNLKSYGDCALGENVIDMKRLDKILEFDNKQGILKAEAGLLLGDMLKFTISKGWFSCLTPGTKNVTLGGCAASDVHGKNNNNVGFSECVKAIEVVTADGKLVKCSRKDNKDLFEATLGGMGLTGAIYSVEIKLRKITSSYIDVNYEKGSGLAETMKILDKNKKYDYSVAWIDTTHKNMGRSVVEFGNHSNHGKLEQHRKSKIKIPFHLPNFALNKLGITILNTLRYYLHPEGKAHIHYDKFFYPLDSIENWNKIYGKRGFIEYQCVFPEKKSKEGIEEIFKIMKKQNNPAFLAIMKRFTKNSSLLSFPIEGYTLAMDFPVSRKTLNMMKKFDKIVKKFEGRIYLSKDSTSTKQMLTSYPELKKWKKIKKKYDPKNKFQSTQSKRLGL